MSDDMHYFDDFEVGHTAEFGHYEVTEEEIIEFATKYDPQSFHVDREKAKHSIFGEIVASGWHTCAMSMRMIVDEFLNKSASLGSPGVDEIRWMKPVYPGDVLTIRLEVVATKASTRKPDRGVTHARYTTLNQHGEAVMSMKAIGMFGRRPKP